MQDGGLENPASLDGSAPRGFAADRSWLATADAWVRYLSEIPAVVILVAEVVVIAAGVTSRYVFHAPLIWTDELASVLFVWLSMLGAVVAFQRSEHMRLSTLVQWMPPHWQPRLHTLGLVLALISIVVILPAALDHAISQQIVTMATLEISELFRSSGVLAGCILLALAIVLQLVRQATLTDALGSVAVAAAVFATVWLCRPLLLSIGNLNLIFFFVILLAVLIVIALPIAFTFILCTVSYLPDHHPYSANRCGEPDGRRDVEHGAARHSALRLSGASDRGDGARARSREFHGVPAWPRAGRSCLRSARRDVSRVRHLRFEGRRYGGGRAGAYPRDETARHDPWRACSHARGLRRHDRDDPAEFRADHDRICDGHFDRRAVSGRLDPRGHLYIGARHCRLFPCGACRRQRHDASILPRHHARFRHCFAGARIADRDPHRRR